MHDPNTRYRLSPEFERAIAVLAATDRRFYATIGASINPELLPTDEARVLVTAIQAVARDTGQGCDGTLMVVQRMMRQMDNGRLKWDELQAANAYLEDAVIAGLPPVDDAVTELRPILQRAMRQDVIHAALDEFGKGDDFTRTTDLIERTRTVGVTSDVAGSAFGAGSFAEIARLRDVEKLPTGVDDVDMHLGGGSARGQVALVTCDTGVGKSMWLSQLYAVALLRGMHVGYATLELPSPVVQARAMAAMTSTPIDDVLRGHELPQQRFEELRPEIGAGWVHDFPPAATTVADIARWVDVCEQQAGRPMDALFLDYMDKLAAPGKTELTSYEIGRRVTEALRSLAARTKHEMWLWTASQPKERKSPNALIDTGDLADSRNKGRLINLMLSGNPRLRDDGGVEIVWFIAKNTTGVSQVKIGPLPHERHLGRIAPSTALSSRWQADLYAGL